MFVRPNTICRGAEDGAGAGGGNADGGANGTGDPAAKPPQYMTVEQFNKGVTERLTRQQQTFAKTLTEQLEAQQAKFEERLAAHGSSDASKSDSKPENAAQERAQKAAEKRISDLEAKLAASAQAQLESAQKTARQEERAKAHSVMSAKGIVGPRANAVAALLYDAGKIKRAEDGAIVFVDGNDEVEFEQGFTTWLTTGEGKEFLPARAVGGSGETARGKGSPSKAKPRPGERLLAALKGT